MLHRSLDRLLREAFKHAPETAPALIKLFTLMWNLQRASTGDGGAPDLGILNIPKLEALLRQLSAETAWEHGLDTSVPLPPTAEKFFADFVPEDEDLAQAQATGQQQQDFAEAPAPQQAAAVPDGGFSAIN